MEPTSHFGFSEAAINSAVASLLCGRGLLAGAEMITRSRRQIRRPDVMMSHQGIRIILEGKIESQQAKQQLLNQCRERITDGLCEVSVGVVYEIPSANGTDLFEALSEPGLRSILRRSTYDVAIWRTDFPEPILVQGWIKKDLNGLADIIKDAVHEAHSIDVLDQTVGDIRDELYGTAARLVSSAPARFHDLAALLAPKLELPKPKNHQEEFRTVQIAFLVLLDATVFYNAIQRGQNLPSISSFHDRHGSYHEALRHSFNAALGINYAPVFEVALDALYAFSADAEDSIAAITKLAYRIAMNRMLLKHDLMGRVYHTLLFKELAKHLATYYTAVTSARVLAALALGAPEADWSDKDLSDLDEIRKLRIADFACGSGTLLSAVHHELERLHSNACYENDRSSDLAELHKVLLDDVISGYDVMLYAAHIATITLAMHNPDAIFKEGHIFVLPFGGKAQNIGSLEFLVRDAMRVRTTAIRMDIKGRREIELKPPEAGFDLLIMNPPFARSCGDNLLFGSETDDDTRTAMQARLSDMLAESGLNGIGHAGLGAAFVGLANRYVKPGGRIAFVLPRNLLSGVSWRKIRDLLMGLLPQKTPHLACYNLEYVLLNTEPPSFSFSENTDLSECMFIARKLKPGEMPLNTLFVLLNGRPKTVFSASELVKAIMGYERKGIPGRALDIFLNPNGKPANIEVGAEDMGKIYAAPAEIVEGNTDNWGRLCAYAVPELTKIAYRLRDKGEFAVSKTFAANIELKPFAEMFEVGVDRRQIHDSFKLSDRGTYKALWGKEIGMNSLSIEPNMRLARQTGADVATISNTRSRLLIAERIRLDTTPLISVLCTEPVLSNVWWTAKSKATDGNSDALQKAMALWLNSTPGLLLLFSELQITQGAWTAIKKAPLEALLALDLDSLEHDKLQAIASLFDSSDSDEFPVLPTQFQEAAQGRGWRHKLDCELLSILSGEQIPNDALRPLYELLIEETKHW